MKNKALLVYGLVFAALVGIFLGTQKNKTSRRGKDKDPGSLVFPQPHQNVRSLTISNQGFKPFTLEQTNGVWTLKEGGYGTDEKEMKALLDAYKIMRHTSSFDMPDAKARKLYGLEGPQEWYDITYQDGEKFKIWIGKQSPVPGNQYVQLNEESVARVILEQDLLFIRKTVHQLREKKIVDIDPETVDQVDMSPSKKYRSTYLRSPKKGVGWTDKKALPVMVAEMDTLLSKFNPLEAMSFVTEKVLRPDAAGQYRLRTRDKREVVVYVWRDGERVLAQVKGRKEVYFLPDDFLSSALGKSLAETRVFPWFPDQLESLSIQTPSGPIKAKLNPGTGKWVCEGKDLKKTCGSEIKNFLDGFSAATAFGMKKARASFVKNREYVISATFRKETDTNPKKIRYELGTEGNFLIGFQNHFEIGFKLEDYMANRLRILQRQSFEKPNF